MIKYIGILERLRDAGYSSYRLAQEKLLYPATLTAIRNNKPINMETLDTICRLAGCQPGDILEYTDEPPTDA